MFASLRTLSRFLCPEYCPRCGCESGTGFCDACRRDFPKVVSACHRCGLPRPCDPCPVRRADWQLDGIHAPYTYGLPLAQYLKTLKYGGQRSLGRVLGHLLAAEIAPRDLGLDAAASVPLHPRRLRSRTFNQADEIADVLARRFGLRMISGVRRNVDTRPQTELDGVERRRFARNVFSVSGNLQGLRIAIVDDVITTAATVNALAAQLKAAGAAHVCAVAVARSVGRD